MVSEDPQDMPPNIDPSEDEAIEPDQAMVALPPILISESEQTEILAQCLQFKKSAILHAKSKKLSMQRCYAYLKSQFYGDDLLPRPASAGADRDNNPNRPEIFIPVVREQVKLLYSNLKLTLFPNDEDFFRIRGKTPAAARFEDILTEGMKYLFKEALISEKMGAFLLDLIWSGNGVARPSFRAETNWSWEIDPVGMQYVPMLTQAQPTVDLEVWDPLHFYLDPSAKDPEKAKWGYFSYKRLQDILDSPLYFNKDKLSTLSTKMVHDSQNEEGLTLSAFNELAYLFEDIEGHLKVDQFYLPYLKTSQREYRNMLVAIAGEQVLIEFRPNLSPRGMNPVVFCTWMNDKESPYGTGPVEDIRDLQRLINILYNYQVETFARIGNRFIVKEGVDLSNFFGVAGGVATAENPQGDIQPITGDYIEMVHLANMIGTLKAEAQIVAGAQDPFQGASNIDFKKTATEIQLLQENSISVLREVIEHISIMGVQRILERLMYLVADLYPMPIPVRLDNGQYLAVDFSLLKSGQFTLELVGINPSQSKAAQIEGLMQLIQLVGTNPELLLLTEPIIEQIGLLQGLKNTPDLIQQIKQRLGVLYAQRQQRVPGP